MDNYTMTVRNFDLEVYSSDEEDYNYPPAIEFTFATNGVVFATLLPEQGIDTWDLLADACETGAHYSVAWDCSNGDCSLTAYKGILRLAVAKYGDGCGGNLDLILAAAPAARGFRRAAELTRDAK